MRNKLVVLLVMAAAGLRPAAADDASQAASQPEAFRRQAETIQELHRVELEHQIAQLKAEIAANDAKATDSKPAAREPAPAIPVQPVKPFVLREISGVSSALVAVVESPDGVAHDLRKGDILPGLGRITAIDERGVLLDGRRRLVLDGSGS